jgi:hypothetical protein
MIEQALLVQGQHGWHLVIRLDRPLRIHVVYLGDAELGAAA